MSNCASNYHKQCLTVAVIDTTSAVINAPLPTEKAKLRYFLGSRNLFSRFIAGFAKRERPLISILSNIPYHYWHCATTEQLESIQELQDELFNPPVFSMPKRGRSFMMDTAARKYSTGGTLLQQQSL